MRSINVATDAVTDGAADQHVGEKMVAPGVARDADGGGKTVSTDLDERMALVFVSHNGGKRPRADGVPGRE